MRWLRRAKGQTGTAPGGKEGEFCLDETGRKNGRGAYLCRNADCLAKARKTKGLDRSFKMAVSPEVYESLEREFVKFESTQ